MSRLYQHIGLTKEAKGFIDDHCEIKKEETVCPHCNKVISTKNVMAMEKIEQVDLFYGDGPDLYIYYLDDGSTIKEVVQEVAWFSGPMVFLCLENEDGVRSCEWRREDIDSML